MRLNMLISPVGAQSPGSAWIREVVRAYGPVFRSLIIMISYATQDGLHLTAIHG